MPLARIDSTKGLVIDNQSGNTGNIVPPTGTSSQLIAGDGTAVNVGSGLSLSAGALTASGGGPKTVYEVDFSTLANQVYTNGQTYTIAGASWTVSNNNPGSTTFQAVNGTGITYSGTGVSGIQFYTNFGSLGITNPFQTIIFWVQCDFALNTGSPVVGFYHRWDQVGPQGLGGNGMPTSNGVAGLSFRDTGTPLIIINQSPTAGGTGGLRSASIGSNNTLVSMLNPNLCVSQYYGQYSGGWPSTLQWMWTNHQPAFYSGTTNSFDLQYQPPYVQPTDPALRGFALVAGLQASNTLTFRRMRVQVV